MPRTKPAMICKQIIRAALAAVVAILLAGLPHATARAGSEVAAARVSVQASPFPRPAALEPNIDFWVNAFTYWSERDFVIHDRDNVSRIYQKFHMPGDGAPTGEEIEWANAYLKAKYGDILNRLATGRQPIGWEEQRVAAMFKGQPASAYALAAQNLRVQQGLCEQFHDSLLRSRYYRPKMEAGVREGRAAAGASRAGVSRVGLLGAGALERRRIGYLAIHPFDRPRVSEDHALSRRSARPGAFHARRPRSFCNRTTRRWVAGHSRSPPTIMGRAGWHARPPNTPAIS